MRLVAYITLISILVGCHGATDKPIIIPDVPARTNTIAQLRDNIVGVGGVDIREEIVVGGRVVAADGENNNYGSIVVEDECGAIEVMIGLPYLEAIYPVGLYVALRLKGCYADYSRGVLQVGRRRPDYEYYSVGNLAYWSECDKVIARSKDVAPVEPMPLTISECRQNMCGRLIKIQGLRLVDSSSVDTLAGDDLRRAIWEGYSMFKDRNGDSIAVYTRPDARYAKLRIPSDSVTIVGTLQKDSYRGSDECYYLKMRYERDCSIY